jgi:hypothetical protein
MAETEARRWRAMKRKSRRALGEIRGIERREKLHGCDQTTIRKWAPLGKGGGRKFNPYRQHHETPATSSGLSNTTHATCRCHDQQPPPSSVLWRRQQGLLGRMTPTAALLKLSVVPWSPPKPAIA